MNTIRNLNIFGDINVKNNETYGIIETSFLDKFYMEFLRKIKMNSPKHNILNFSISGSSRNYYNSLVFEKTILSEMIETIGKNILGIAVKEEAYRQKFFSESYSEGFGLIDESESLQKQRYILFSYHSRIHKFTKKKKISNKKKNLPYFDFKNTSLLLPFFLEFSSGKILLTMNPDIFPYLKKTSIAKLKIFQNFSYFSFRNNASFSKKNSEIKLRASRGFVAKKTLFFFIVFFKEKRMRLCYNFCEYFLRLFFNLALFIKEPIGILFISLDFQQKKQNNGMNRKKIPGEFKPKILSNPIRNSLVSNFDFLSRTHLWVILCVSKYLEFLFEKIHRTNNLLSNNNRYFFNMNKIVKKSNKFFNKSNLIFQLSKFSGISETRNLIRRFVCIRNSKVNKILVGFSKKKKFLIFFQKIIEEVLYTEGDITEVVVNSDPKKNKIELAIKMGKNQICQNIWFQIIRGNRIVANFWAKVRTQWKILEISWVSKKNSSNHFSPVVIPDFKINTRKVNFLFFQETQNWKKINWFLYNQNTPLVFPFSVFAIFLQEKGEGDHWSSYKFPTVKKEKSHIISEIIGTKNPIGILEIPIAFFDYLVKNIKNPGKTFSFFLFLLKLFRKKKIVTEKKILEIRKLFWRKLFNLKSLKKKMELLRIFLINVIAFNWKNYSVYFF